VFTVQMHFAPAHVVPQALHIRTNLQVFWVVSRQLGWKFSHCFTGCGGVHVTTWKDPRTEVLHLFLRPKPECPLKPESQYLMCSLLLSFINGQEEERAPRAKLASLDLFNISVNTCRSSLMAVKNYILWPLQKGKSPKSFWTASHKKAFY